ncbi:MAG: hypothetical protein ABJA83_11765 [Burkholderiaceae bacterium]
MRLIAIALLCVTTVTMAAENANELDLTGYQSEDGAIRANFGGNVVDPYFASKALLEAKRLGLDISAPGLSWINWALARQSPDGRLERYCNRAAMPDKWSVCASADADDAMMAIWIQLLIAAEPVTGMPAAWRTSMARASRQLMHLRHRRSGLYQISATQPVALFMDNIEAYAALRAAARDQQRTGHRATSRKTLEDAENLRRQVVKTFWNPSTKRFKVSTQFAPEHAFYPDEVAQIYPWLDDVATEEGGTDTYAEWMRRNGTSWLDLEADHYPWGLVALAAYKAGDSARTQCWLVKSAPLRYSARWNILEEALFQGLQANTRHVSQKGEPCSRIAG